MKVLDLRKLSLVLVLVCAVWLLLAVTVAAGPNDVWPTDCKFNCTANDITVDAVWLGDESGNAICDCTPGAPVVGTLWLTINNHTGTDRYAVKALYTYTVGSTVYANQTMCVADTLPNGITYVADGSVTWNCGEALDLNSMVLSWHTTPGLTCANTQTGNDACPPPGQSWCAEDIPVGGPITANLISSSPDCLGETTYFTLTVQGGTPPYDLTWNFGDGSPEVVVSDVTVPYYTQHTYATADPFTAGVGIVCDAGCSTEVTTQVVIGALPNCQITVREEEVCAGGEGYHAAVVSAGEGATYAWTVEGGTLVEGQNTPSIIFDAGPVGPVTLRVTVTNASGCQCTGMLPVSLVNCGAAAVGDLVWNDLNANGIQNPGEPGISGLTVRLFSAGLDGLAGTPDDVLFGTTTTDANGLYGFTGLVGGAPYFLTVTAPPGGAVSPPNVDGDDKDSDLLPVLLRTEVFSVPAGTTDNDWDMGFFHALLAYKYRPHGDVCATHNFWYYIYVTNTTDIPLFAVQIVDKLPDGIAPYSVQTGIGYPFSGEVKGGQFDGTNLCTWTIPVIAPHGSASVWIRARTYSWAAGQCLTNKALINAAGVPAPVEVSDVFCVPRCQPEPPKPTPVPTPEPTPLPGTVVELRAGVGDDNPDTYIYRYGPTTNHATETLLRVGYKQMFASLLRFDLTGIPAGAVIDEAWLKVYAAGWGGLGANIKMEAYAVLKTVKIAQATWYDAETGSVWSMPGCGDPVFDRRADPEYALTTDGPSKWYSFDVTKLVQDWMGGLANNGVLLRQGASTPRAFLFASAEHADPALRPVLVVRYH